MVMQYGPPNLEDQVGSRSCRRCRRRLREREPAISATTISSSATEVIEATQLAAPQWTTTAMQLYGESILPSHPARARPGRPKFGHYHALLGGGSWRALRAQTFRFPFVNESPH